LVIREPLVQQVLKVLPVASQGLGLMDPQVQLELGRPVQPVLQVLQVALVRVSKLVTQQPLGNNRHSVPQDTQQQAVVFNVKKAATLLLGRFQVLIRLLSIQKVTT